VGWSEWTRGPEVEPSIYAADFARLGNALAALLDAGAKIFQFDVGDGHFVEPITIGPIVLRAISPLFRERGGILDVHLMVDNPRRHFAQFAKAGADSVTAHVEVLGDEVSAAAADARELGLGFGLAVSPDTAAEEAAAHASEVDLLLVMGVHPGYSGQAFIPETTERVRRLRELLPGDVAIQVDGGVGAENIAQLHEAGATLFVGGSSVFDGVDPPSAYHRLTELLA
jgi:ribulose-phosphate 3-epimerase